MSISSSTVPLHHVFPWGDHPIQGGRTLLICDSVETDGQFVLYTITKQFLTWSPNKVDSSHSYPGIHKRRVLWICCGTSTPVQIQSTLKRMGAKFTNFDSRDSLHDKQDHSLHVISVPQDIATQSMPLKTNSSNNNSITWDGESFLRELYGRIQSLVLMNASQESSAVLILLDQISSLATMVGPLLALKFTLALRGWMKKQPYLVEGLVISSSHDIEQEHLFTSIQQGQRNISVGGGQKSEWVGAGGGCVDLGGLQLIGDRWTHLDEDRAQYFLQGPTYAWERGLVELADGIIDVIPLSSGYSRDVHGRLIFTKGRGGKGWADSSSGEVQKIRNGFSSNVFNYSFGENGSVRVFRLKNTE